MSFDDKAFPILQPKAHIAFVLGYDRLLLKNSRQVQEAIASGKTVLFRSEHAKEVHDFSGIFNSIEVNSERVEQALRLFPQRVTTVERLTGVRYSPELHGSQYEYLLQKSADGFIQVLQRDIHEAAFILACAGFDYTYPSKDVRRQYTERELMRLFQDTHRPPSLHAQVLNTYCEHWGLNPEHILSGLSFSPWEKLRGKIVSMQKDPHIAGRYHVIMLGTGSARGGSRYTIEDGMVAVSSDSPQITRKDMNKTIARELIKTYEDALNKAHLTHAAPILECIVDAKQVTPVQLHMSRLLELVTPFEIPESITKEGSGWEKAQFVQGVTPVRGIGIELHATKDRWNSGTFEYGAFLPRLESSTSFKDENDHYVCMYIPMGGGFETAIDTHGPVNQAFMPKISLTMKPAHVPESLSDHAATSVAVRIISNGREAYVRFDEPQVK